MAEQKKNAHPLNRQLYEKIQQKSSAWRQSRLRFGPRDSPVIFFLEEFIKAQKQCEISVEQNVLSSKILL